MSAIKTAIAVGSALGLLGAAPALVAHHSAAIFDDTKVIELTGTVNALQWTNPHIWLQVVVKQDAAETEWSFAGGSRFAARLDPAVTLRAE
jgi:hypothetical protein